MGTWGYNYFENDAAFDYMADIEETDDAADMVEDIFSEAEAAEYLDYDTASAVVVAAAYIDRQVNGTRYSEPDLEDALDIDTFFDRNPAVNLAPYRSQALPALRKVLAEDSELHELWAENEEDYPAWRGTIEALISRLEGGSGLRAV